MKRLLAILATLSALQGAVPFVRPRTLGGAVLLWLPKLVGMAQSPITGLVGALATLVGLAQRDWLLAGTGLLGAGLSARLAADMPAVDQVLSDLPGWDSEGSVPRARRRSTSSHLSARTRGQVWDTGFERDLVVGHNPESDRALLADLWPPSNGRPSGLGLIYAHGSGWRVGDKDMGTRPFFRRLTAQGHLVLDLAYSLWPGASLPAMIAEVNQAILWLKEHGPAHGVRPDGIVVMGGSAGGHLALMAAYTPGHPAFRPPGKEGDTTVRGVIAFYPPVDLGAWEAAADDLLPTSPGLADRLGLGMLQRVFQLEDSGTSECQLDRFFGPMLGGLAQSPDRYELLSPIHHVGGHCPPTLLLQGSDDVFRLAPGVRRLHERLRATGVPSALLEFPHCDHAFDLLMPQISPPARAATRGVEQFLAWLQ